MPLSTAQWHQRYQQQAQWTHDLRNYIYNRVQIAQATKILDVGCGTGVLEVELSQLCSAGIFGLDIEPHTIGLAHQIAPSAIYTIGNALQLPYQSASFDIALCHFLLLWVSNAVGVITELSRVTRRGGHVLALAEPDYGGRIDYPPELSRLGSWQREALQDQGANPLIGRELRRIFTLAGLTELEAGVLGAQWHDKDGDEELDLEWQVIRSDLDQQPAFIQQSDRLYAIDKTSRQSQYRVLFVPTFYAFGKVKG
jgi:SAM-dependent methyltransferase